jgi:hypothetical protein
MRLEKTQTWIAAGLTIALFGGILVLPYWGQVVWVALIDAAWLRVVIVIPEVMGGPKGRFGSRLALSEATTLQPLGDSDNVAPITSVSFPLAWL